MSSTTHGTFKDRWKRHSTNRLVEEAYWTGQTKFKIKPNWQSQAQQDYKKANNGYKSYKPTNNQINKKKKGKDEVFERNMMERHEQKPD